MKTIKKICLYCNKEFDASLREHKRGNAKYCCKEHSQLARKGTIRVKPNVTCSYCGKEFHKSKFKQKLSRSGLYFCCREHKDLAQCLDFGLTIIQPPHFGTGKPENIDYRKIAFKNYPNECSICGYHRLTECLVVHHKDRNRNNCEIENLQILCPTCHTEIHFLSTTGYWAKKTQD